MQRLFPEEDAPINFAHECLEAMKNGERDLDKLASRYPWARDEIRPLLDIGLELQSGVLSDPRAPMPRR